MLTPKAISVPPQQLFFHTNVVYGFAPLTIKSICICNFHILFYFTISKSYFINYTISFYNTTNISFTIANGNALTPPLNFNPNCHIFDWSNAQRYPFNEIHFRNILPMLLSLLFFIISSLNLSLL